MGGGEHFVLYFAGGIPGGLATGSGIDGKE